MYHVGSNSLENDEDTVEKGISEVATSDDTDNLESRPSPRGTDLSSMTLGPSILGRQSTHTLRIAKLILFNGRKPNKRANSDKVVAYGAAVPVSFFGVV
ncbi:hypothetical protein VKT23_018157 [Stygiomarasmius scandens]|uniref:Uncharacterized protein n=1 Tax=Marasmiellus scandens TaxID=2682957 RepID=A0ABR1IQA6_9AGAR